MKKRWVFALAAGLFLLGACKGKRKEIPVEARQEAEQNASEAAFATQIREYDRADKLLTKAIELNPTSRYWRALGIVRKKKGDSSGAKKAYEKALDIAIGDYEESKRDQLPPLFDEIELDVILGRAEDARKTLDQASRDHPTNPQIKNMIQEKVIDRMLTDPALKELSP